ncbi:MAG: aminotransferase class V-fold PLP-dependent enzyme [Mycobacteriales bacterium]|nr:aminotransferase class V-fold PLP-dependent enzyme [Mycobacteriales bacterium]
MSAQRWVEERLPTQVRHLDVAACGRVSTGVLEAQVAHLRAEADGGYVAHEAAEPELAKGREALASMVGLAATDVAHLESAHEAFWALLAVWPLPPGSRIGMVTSEYGPNALVLRALAGERGWTLVPLPVDRRGRVLGVPQDLDLVTLPQVASQRGIAQPVEEVLRSGVPVVLDVAQSLGQTEVPAGAAAYVGTSRTWLCGPRGVGFLVVDPSWELRLGTPPTGARYLHSGVRRIETMEAHVAGRLGLGVAAQEWRPELLPVVRARSARLRAALDDTAWEVREPVEEPTGITTLTAPEGVDVVAVRADLLARGTLTTAVPAHRSADLAGPALRVSTAAWVSEDDVDEVADALVGALPGGGTSSSGGPPSRRTSSSASESSAS